MYILIYRVDILHNVIQKDIKTILIILLFPQSEKASTKKKKSLTDSSIHSCLYITTINGLTCLLNISFFFLFTC